MSGSMSFFADGATWVNCHDYGDQRPPILAVSGGGISLSISGHHRAPLADQLTFARNLASEAAQYLTALETFAASEPTKAE